jgi:hypothetical protein
MRYLVDYYDKTICPVLVAVDGPKNPYRLYILGLAAASGPALVNAIAALSANVLHLRTRGLGEDQFTIQSQPTQFTNEEALHYKTTAVNLFNAAVQDPASVQDDSVLGTLLVLSLFTICDTGFCNFKSQMTVVRRILAMRGSNSTQFLHWATFFFTWLDIMCATVSDRENQVRHNTLDLLDFSANLGSLEHLAFCEGRMLKVVSRVGPPKAFSPQWSGQETPSPFSSSFMPSPRQAMPRRQSYASDAILNGHSKAAESRHEFWSEWLHVRSRLRTWSRDAVSSHQDSSVAHEAESILVTHASEVFRHAALLFAERQAFPHVAPSSTQIQHLVAGALHHLSSIPTLAGINKFLLWPLCVIGTDCVRPMDRDVIRLRCGEAMREPGFFQSSAGLDVMERVWASEDANWDAGMNAWEMKCAVDMPRLSSLGGLASRWSRAMRMMAMDYGLPI